MYLNYFFSLPYLPPIPIYRVAHIENIGNICSPNFSIILTITGLDGYILGRISIVVFSKGISGDESYENNHSVKAKHSVFHPYFMCITAFIRVFQ